MAVRNIITSVSLTQDTWTWLQEKVNSAREGGHKLSMSKIISDAVEDYIKRQTGEIQ